MSSGRRRLVGYLSIIWNISHLFKSDLWSYFYPIDVNTQPNWLTWADDKASERASDEEDLLLTKQQQRWGRSASDEAGRTSEVVCGWTSEGFGVFGAWNKRSKPKHNRNKAHRRAESTNRRDVFFKETDAARPFACSLSSPWLALKQKKEEGGRLLLSTRPDPPKRGVRSQAETVVSQTIKAATSMPPRIETPFQVPGLSEP